MNSDYINGTEEERAQFRSWIKNALEDTIVTVVFEKKDGTLRTMNCTLMEGAAIPHVKTTDRVKTPSNDTCSVWDVEKNEWRSFRYDAINEINFTLGIGVPDEQAPN
jgi:hypothetical protein